MNLICFASKGYLVRKRRKTANFQSGTIEQLTIGSEIFDFSNSVQVFDVISISNKFAKSQVFTHYDWKQEGVLETGLSLVFLSCPKLAFLTSLESLVIWSKRSKTASFWQILVHSRVFFLILQTSWTFSIKLAQPDKTRFIYCETVWQLLVWIWLFRTNSYWQLV